MCTQPNVIEALREAEAALELAIKRILKRDPGHHVEVTSEAKALVSVRQALQCQGCDVPKDGVYQISQPSHSMSQYANKDDMLRAVLAENERLKAQLAAAQQGAQDAEPAAWVATFKPEGLLALHSVVGANLEELKQSVPGNSVFRPLYTHPSTQGLDAQAIERAAQKLAEIAEYNWVQLTEKQCEEFRTDALSALTAALGLGHE